jgi:nucleoside-diphosphate-sugar epimerase
MKYKSLLIVGGTGFFGKSILDYFHNYNSLKINKIIIFSRRAHKIKINKTLKKKIKITTMSGNILKIKELPRVDYVIYAAILKNYSQDLKAVKNYLNLAVKYHLNSKILYISSGAVYGTQRTKEKKMKENYLEKYKKINFKNGYKKNYSVIKLKNENLFKELGTQGLKISIARCFTFVGRHLPLNSHYVIGNIINNILKKRKINIKSNYKIVRSYMYSDVLVSWLLKILNHSNISCPIYNVGSDNKISIQNTAENLAKNYFLNFSYPKINLIKKDIYIPCVYKAKKVLKLKNNISSMEAIIKTIKLLKQDDNKKKHNN